MDNKRLLERVENGNLKFEEEVDGLTVHVGVVRRMLTNDHGLTIRPRRLSAFWSRAQSREGFLTFAGWETNDDSAGRNQGRPARYYRVKRPT